MANLRSQLYKAARLIGDVQAVASADRKKIQRRVKNKAIDKAAGIAGFWRAHKKRSQCARGRNQVTHLLSDLTTSTTIHAL